jgi:hypothetical protein
MGKSESTQCYSHCIEAVQAHNISGRQKENRSRTAGKVGEVQSGEEEIGGLAACGTCCEAADEAVAPRRCFRRVSGDFTVKCLNSALDHLMVW